MSYHTYVTGRMTIEPPLPSRELYELRAWLKREEVSADLQGLVILSALAFYDNDAPWRLGVDADLCPERFAARLSALVEKVAGKHGDQTMRGEFTISRPTADDLDALVCISCDGDQVKFNGSPVTATEQDSGDPLPGIS